MILSSNGYIEIVIYDSVLENHLNTWSPVFVGVFLIHGDVISLMRRFSDKSDNELFHFFFVENVNSLMRATHDYHLNLVTTNSKKSTVCA